MPKRNGSETDASGGSSQEQESAHPISTVGAEDLRVGEGDTVHLSPDSPNFQRVFQQVRPQTIDEVKRFIGIHIPPGESVIPLHIRFPELATRVVATEELESDEPPVRAEARALTYLAAREYVRGDSSRLEQWKPLFDRYIELSNPLLNIAVFGDIDVANGGTLIISGNTLALYANHVRLHGSGKIVCRGPTTFKFTSLEGNLGIHHVVPTRPLA